MTSDHITAYAGNVFWFKSSEILPEHGAIVLVSGGIAFCSKQGVWYTETGGDHGLPISWDVEYWAELPKPPKST